MSNQTPKPRDLLQGAFEHWKIVLAVFVAANCMAYYKAKNVQSAYQSGVLLQVDVFEKSVMPGIDDVEYEDLSDSDVLNTIVQTINNQRVMRQVVITNNLATDPRFVSDTNHPPDDDALARRLSRMVKATLRPETRLIDVEVKSKDPELPPLLADSVADEFIRQYIHRKIDSNEIARKRLQEEADLISARIKGLSQRMLTFRRTNNVADIEQERQRVNARLTELHSRLDSEEAMLRKVEQDREIVTHANGMYDMEELMKVSLLAEDPTMEAYFKQFLDERSKLRMLRLRYKEKHPKMVEATASLQTLTTVLTNMMGGGLGKVEQLHREHTVKLQELKEQIKKVREEALELESMNVTYGDFKRELDADIALHLSVVDRIKEINLTKGLQDEMISVVENASPSSEISADKPQILMGGAAMGLALGFGLIYLITMLDSSIKSVDQAEEVLKLSVLGAVPSTEENGRPSTSRLVMQNAPNSSCAEAFRTLRANIETLGKEQSKRVILFTSAMPSEGKTFAAINYGTVLAQQGLKTLLVDLDLRNPSIGGEFGLDGKAIGVTNLLLDQESFEIFPRLPIPEVTKNLHVLHGGPHIPNPAEHLGGQWISELIRKAGSRFDRIIMDSAPLNPVGDTIPLVRLAGVICLVVKTRKTASRTILRCIETLRRLDHPPSGLILNYVPTRSGYGGYYYYYGDKYGSRAYKKNGRVPKGKPEGKRGSKAEEPDEKIVEFSRKMGEK